MIILALTPAPFYMHYSLGKDPNQSNEKFIPDCLVMLGGGGMPSEDNLMRLYYSGQFAEFYQVPVIIIHPDDSLSQVKMTRILENYGISEDKITFFTKGTNTRLQALYFIEEFPELVNKKIILITSPSHLKRSVKCFNKLGFTNVRGQAAFESTVNFDLSIDNLKLKGNKYVPVVKSTNFRYTFWNYLKLEIICFREYTAICYYWLKGWI